MNPLRIIRGLFRELRAKGVRGGMRSATEYVRWRRAGSPAPEGPITLEDWHAAYGLLLPDETADVLFSIVCPVHNTPPRLLEECVSSVLSQTYRKWELILVDDASTRADTIATLEDLQARDPRIRLHSLESNAGISAATNAGAAISAGSYLVFMDHDDLLAPTALSWLGAVAGDADLIYSDEDKLYEDGSLQEAFFKPDWSPRLLLGINYVSHLTGVRADLFREVGGLRPVFDGAQDHDLLLRLSERDITVAHLPNLLYHWRAWSESTAAVASSKVEVEARGVAMVQEAIERRGWKARAGLGNGSPFNYRVFFEPFDDPISVKAIVPTRDRAELLAVALDGLWNRTDGVKLHTVIVDNGSREPETLELLEQAAARDDTTVVHLDDAFNFSRLCNMGVTAGPPSDLVLLLNNDVEIEHRDWLLQLTGWLRDPGVVGVGPKLLFDDGTIQHGGVVVGFGGIAGHYSAYQPNQPRTGDLHDQAREVGCLTAACLLMRTDDFSKLGGMNETLGIDFQDVDLCLRLRHVLGGELMYDPTYPLKHAQSASRGTRDAVNGYTVARMRFLWGPELAGDDPYYSPHLSRWQHDLSLRDIPVEQRSARLRPRVYRPR